MEGKEKDWWFEPVILSTCIVTPLVLEYHREFMQYEGSERDARFVKFDNVVQRRICIECLAL